MLNAKTLSALLSQNRDDRLCKRWYLMTPNGTLLAYSQPADINDLRKQAAIAALSWQEYARQVEEVAADEESQRTRPNNDVQEKALHFLSIESQHSNLVIQRLQKQLLLVLEGGVPPRRSTFERKITAECTNGASILPHQPNSATESGLASSATSRAESSVSSVVSSVLQIHRQRLDALATAIAAEFERTGFRMPEEGNTTFF